MGSKITDEQLKDLANQGIGPTEAAKRLGVTKGLISVRYKKLGIAPLRTPRQGNVTAYDWGKLYDRTCSLIDRLEKLVREDSTPARKMEVVTKLLKELGKQQKFLLDMEEKQAIKQAHEQFINEVCGVIADVAPEARARIEDRLREKQALCGPVLPA